MSDVGLNPKDVVICRFSSLGEAYQSTELVKKQNELVQILEVLPLGPVGHIIYFSDAELLDLTSLISAHFQHAPGFQIHHFRKLHPSVLRAYLSVENANIAESMIVSESFSLGQIFAVAEKAVTAQLKIMDLRQIKGANGLAHLFLTGPREACQKFVEQVDVENTKTQILLDPINSVKELFFINC